MRVITGYSAENLEVQSHIEYVLPIYHNGEVQIVIDLEEVVHFNFLRFFLGASRRTDYQIDLPTNPTHPTEIVLPWVRLRTFLHCFGNQDVYLDSVGIETRYIRFTGLQRLNFFRYRTTTRIPATAFGYIRPNTLRYARRLAHMHRGSSAFCIHHYRDIPFYPPYTESVNGVIWIRFQMPLHLNACHFELYEQEGRTYSFELRGRKMYGSFVPLRTYTNTSGERHPRIPANTYHEFMFRTNKDGPTIRLTKFSAMFMNHLEHMPNRGLIRHLNSLE